MSTISLTLKRQPSVPLEAEVISPDGLAELPHAEIAALTVYHGKRRYRLDEFFEVEGERSDTVHLRGDLHRVRWIGRDMSRGKIRVSGSVGMHLGSGMSGGEIEVQGDAGDWVGAEMKGGLIRVHGNAGGQVGAAYRGSMQGMRNGVILVSGSAGLEVGMRMRRGVVVIGGAVKDFAGLQMKGGTIVLAGGAEVRTGAWMVRGTIISLKPLPVLPTFRFDCSHNPPFLSLLARNLETLGVRLPYRPSEGRYEQFTGDAAVPGRGELLVWQTGS